MKYFYLLFGLIPALLAGNPAFAQISIDEVDAKEDKVTFQDKLKSTSVDVDYFSLARYKAERAAIRKERNYLEFSGGIQGSLTSYNDPWISVSGGDNSIALTAVFGLRHLFTKNLFTLETKFNAKLGYNRMKVETTQKDDEGNEYTDTGFLRYRTTLYSFYGWITDIGQKNKISDYSEYRIAYDDWVEKGSDIKTKPRLPIHPIVRWENTIDIKATKYLDVQTRTLLSVGLTYTFKNKEKPQK